MSQNLFVQNTIAIIWDFDKTISPKYMQEPLFRRYGIDGAGFWAEVDGLEDLYLRHGAKRVSKDTLYLNHILTYVRAGVFKGLNNNVLRELGSEIELYEGLPTFFDQVKQSVASDGSFVKHGLQVNTT